MNHYWMDIYAAAQPWLTKALQHMQTPYAWVELFSMACALLGSLLLALKGKHAGWGWVLFAFSNAGWIVFSQGYGHWFFLVQQIGFSITSGIGIWRYLVKPPAAEIFATFTALKHPCGPVDVALPRVTHLTSLQFYKSGGQLGPLATEVHLDNAKSIYVLEDRATVSARLSAAGWRA